MPAPALRRLAAALVVLVLAVSAVAPARASAQAPSLAGEFLQSTAQNFTSTANCDATGTSSFTFATSGIAGGPYPGTFTETGSVQIGPQTGTPSQFAGFEFNTGPVLTLTTQFTIVSGDTQITGTKRLVSDPLSEGGCIDFTGRDLAQGPFTYLATEGTYRRAGAFLLYEATITSPSGATSVSGDAALSINELRAVEPSTGRSVGGFEFNETYLTSEPVPPPPPDRPGTTDECKDDEWKRYHAPAFTNQGDCVSFVATEGRNPPAG